MDTQGASDQAADPGQRPVVLVDREGRALGLCSKAEAHQGAGRLHRAFTVVLFDSQGRLVLARRAGNKLLWPDVFDASVASHPWPEEIMLQAAGRRLREELGCSADLDDLGSFEYVAPYMDLGVERERCAALFGQLLAEAPWKPLASEVSEVRCMGLTEVLESTGPVLCPWAYLALHGARMHPAWPASLAAVLAPLREPALGELLDQALKRQFPSGGWRLLSPS